VRGQGEKESTSKALKIMDHRKSQAGQEEAVLPLTEGQIQNQSTSARLTRGGLWVLPIPKNGNSRDLINTENISQK
jgi:hypothetical protein